MRAEGTSGVGWVGTTPQYAPPVPPGAQHRLERRYPTGSAEAQLAASARDDLVKEVPTAPGVFEQEHGPFIAYRRVVVTEAQYVHETITYGLHLPAFGWLYGPLVRRSLRRRPGADHPRGRQPWWAPHDRLDDRQVLVLGLLAAASMCSAYVNTLFTQMVHAATDNFGVGSAGQGWAGAIVRIGIVLALPVAFRADSHGRRRVVVWLAYGAPVVCALGALAPNFVVLVATQTLGRPLGIALDLLIAVVAIEEVPRDSRAYALSVLTMAGGLGAGLCVALLPLASIAGWAWRLPFAATLVWLVVAGHLRAHLPETVRFARPHATTPRLGSSRLVVMGVIAFAGNLFVAPASFFQNRYLDHVRHYSNFWVTVFTFVTTTPAGLGLLAGGWLADRHGRRLVGAAGLITGTAALTVSFAIGGSTMWLTATAGGILLGVTVPALTVYRTELFPTASRGRAGGIITTASLIGGSVGLVITGIAVGRHHSYGAVLGALALGQALVAVLVVTRLPESAHRELEELNPEDLGSPTEPIRPGTTPT